MHEFEYASPQVEKVLRTFIQDGHLVRLVVRIPQRRPAKPFDHF
jgi:hypothetical protein